MHSFPVRLPRYSLLVVILSMLNATPLWTQGVGYTRLDECWIVDSNGREVPNPREVSLDELDPSDQRVIRAVVDRLLPHVDVAALRRSLRVEKGLELIWPPVLLGSRCEEIPNAYARIDSSLAGYGLPNISVYAGEVRKTARGSEDVLAFTIGHELGHVALLHDRAMRPYLELAARRENERAADDYGMTIALEAGYSREGIITNLKRMWEQGSGLFPDAVAEGFLSTHPVTAERIERLAIDRPHLWRSLSDFGDGARLLLLEQPGLAAEKFLRVTEVYPKSHEAWANLGIALLQQYASQLTTSDIEQFDLGFISAGYFYPRAAYLEEKVFRGVDAELWDRALDALSQARQLSTTPQTHVQVAVGIAHLVHKSGFSDGETALKYFQSALKDPALQAAPHYRVRILSNSAVAELAIGDLSGAKALLDSAKNVLTSNPNYALASALAYNSALIAEKEGRYADARREYKTFLESGSQASLWYPLAKKNYQALGGAGWTPNPSTGWRPVVSVFSTRFILAPEPAVVRVSLGESMTSVFAKLGPPDSHSRKDPSEPYRSVFQKHGLAVWGYDHVIMIQAGLNSLLPYSSTLRPKVHVKASRSNYPGVGVVPAQEVIGIGERRSDLGELVDLCGQPETSWWRDFFFQGTELRDWRISIEYCRELGIGLGFTPTDEVARIYVVPGPKQD